SGFQDTANVTARSGIGDVPQRRKDVRRVTGRGSSPITFLTPSIRQWSHAAGGVVQTSECTVTFKCEGCGVRKPEPARYRPRSAVTVCSQQCLDTAAQKKAQTLHDPRRRDLLATD